MTTTGRTSSAAELNRSRDEAEHKKFGEALGEINRIGTLMQQWREGGKGKPNNGDIFEKLNELQNLFMILQKGGESEDDPLHLAYDTLHGTQQELRRLQNLLGTRQFVGEDQHRTSEEDDSHSIYNHKLMAGLTKLFPEDRKQVKITHEMRALFRSIGGQLAYYHRHFTPFQKFRELLETDRINMLNQRTDEERAQWLYQQLMILSECNGAFNPTQQQALQVLALAIQNTTPAESTSHMLKMMDKAMMVFDDPQFVEEPLTKRINDIGSWFTEFGSNKAHGVSLRNALFSMQAAIAELECGYARRGERMAMFDSALDTITYNNTNLAKVLPIVASFWEAFKNAHGKAVLVDDVPQKLERKEPQPLERLDVGGGAYRITNEWLEWVFYTYEKASLAADEVTVEETKDLITKLIHDHVGQMFAQPNIQHQLPRGTGVSVIFPSEGGGLVFITQDVSSVLGKPEKE